MCYAFIFLAVCINSDRYRFNPTDPGWIDTNKDKCQSIACKNFLISN